MAAVINFEFIGGITRPRIKVSTEQGMGNPLVGLDSEEGFMNPDIK